jgi:hypothetical protein
VSAWKEGAWKEGAWKGTAWATDGVTPPPPPPSGGDPDGLGRGIGSGRLPQNVRIDYRLRVEDEEIIIL